MSLEYYLCSEFYTFLLAVFIFFFIIRDGLNKSDKFNQVANRDPDIKKLNRYTHYSPKLITAPGYIKNKKLRKIHIIFALKTSFYFFLLILFIILIGILQSYMLCAL